MHVAAFTSVEEIGAHRSHDEPVQQEEEKTYDVEVLPNDTPPPIVEKLQPIKLPDVLPNPKKVYEDVSHDRAPPTPETTSVATPKTEEASDLLTASGQSASLPHFSINVGTDTTQHRVVAKNPSPGSNEVIPIAEASVSIPARLISGVIPPYPAAAREHEIEADVPLEIVVDASGNVVSARPETMSGYGLDAAAVGAIKRCRFSPAQRLGQPVAVRMHWVVQFRLE